LREPFPILWGGAKRSLGNLGEKGPRSKFGKSFLARPDRVKIKGGQRKKLNMKFLEKTPPGPEPKVEEGPEKKGKEKNARRRVLSQIKGSALGFSVKSEDMPQCQSEMRID